MNRSMIVASLIAVAFMGGAADFTWNGGGGDNNWMTSGNWGGTAPASDGTAKLIFAGTTRLTPANNYPAGTVFAGIELQNSGASGKTGSFSLSGNQIILGANISSTAVSAGTLTDTISLPMVLNSDRSINASSSGSGKRTLTISGVISDGGGARNLTKTGNSELKLTGNNTYSGQTIINSGTLYFSSIKDVGGGASALGAPTTEANGTIKATASVTLRYTGNTAATDRRIELPPVNNSLTFYNDKGGGTLTLNGDISGVGQLTFRAANNFVVNGKISGNSVTRTDKGVVYLNNAANDFANYLSISDGTFEFAAIADKGIACPIGTGSEIQFGQIAYFTTGQIRFTGAQGGASDRDILIRSTNGVHGARINNSVAGQNLVLSGEVKTSFHAQSLATTKAPLFLAGDGNIELAGKISERVSVITEGSGIYTLSGNNLYEGDTLVNSGTLLVNSSTTVDSTVTVAAGATLGGTGTINGPTALNAGAILRAGIDGVGQLTLGNSGNNALTLNATTLQFKLSEEAEECNSVVVAGTLVLNGDTTIVLDTPSTGAPAGTYTLMTFAGQTGAGTIKLDRNYPNATLVDTGTTLKLVVEGAGTFGSMTWVGDATLNAWDYESNNWSVDIFEDNMAVVFDDSGSNDPAVTITPTAVAPFSINVNNNLQDYVFSGGAISGAGGIIKDGVKELTLNNANTFTGPVEIKNGQFNLNGSLDGANIMIANIAKFVQNSGSVIAGEDVTLLCEGTTTLAGANTFGGTATLGVLGVFNYDCYVNHAQALGSTAGETILNGGVTGTRQNRLILGNGVTVVGETLTLYGPGSNRSALFFDTVGGEATWAGDIKFYGSAFIEAVRGTLKIGASTDNVCSNITAGGGYLNIRGASGTVVLNGRFLCSPTYSISRNDPGTFLINTTGNIWGNTSLAQGTIRLGIANGLPTTTVLTIGKSDNTADCIFDLNGFEQTIAGLGNTHYAAGSGTQVVTSEMPATLIINTTGTYDFGLTGSTIQSAVTVVKSGTGKQTLSGVNTLSGAVIVSNGTLAVSGTLGDNCEAVVAAGGTLELKAENALGSSAVVYMPERGVSDAKISIDAGVEAVANRLVYGTVFKAIGTYGATGSGAQYIDNTHFSGSGRLKVLSSKSGMIILIQ